MAAEGETLCWKFCDYIAEHLMYDHAEEIIRTLFKKSTVIERTVDDICTSYIIRVMRAFIGGCDIKITKPVINADRKYVDMLVDRIRAESIAKARSTGVGDPASHIREYVPLRILRDQNGSPHFMFRTDGNIRYEKIGKVFTIPTKLRQLVVSLRGEGG